MIDWQDIPLHIRCTNRHLIDETYPGGHKYWHQLHMNKSIQQDRATTQYQRSREHRPKALTERSKTLLKLLREHGQLSFTELKAYMGEGNNGIEEAINALTHSSLIWEDNPDYFRVFGLSDMEEEA